MKNSGGWWAALVLAFSMKTHTQTKHYVMRREGGLSATDRGFPVVSVREGDAETRLDPAPSQKVRNHSPDGFEFGYAGSGPAQLALAILLDFTGRPPPPACYQSFKFFFLAGMRTEGGTITGAQIQAWLDKWNAELKGVYQGS